MSTITLSRSTHVRTEFTDISDTAPIEENLLVQVLEPYAYKGCRYVLDASYKASGLSYDLIDAIFLSHLHSDHVGGFFMLSSAITQSPLRRNDCGAS